MCVVYRVLYVTYFCTVCMGYSCNLLGGFSGKPKSLYRHCICGAVRFFLGVSVAFGFRCAEAELNHTKALSGSQQSRLVACRYLDAIQVLDLGSDIPLAHAQEVHGQNFGLDLVTDGCLVLLYQLGLKSADPIAGCVQFKGAGSALDRLAGLAVFAVGNHFLGQVGIQLAFQGRLGEFLDQWEQRGQIYFPLRIRSALSPIRNRISTHSCE